MLHIEIDSGSGFCFGVTTAISKAEEELAEGKTLYCLGDIVHNGMECERLRRMGLITINHDDLRRLHDVKVLLRAHGEPPETYELARRNNIEIIDATCPVVLQLQRRIKKQYEESEEYRGQRIEERGVRNASGAETSSADNSPYTLHTHPSTKVPETTNVPNSQIVIFGKKGHAEVLGLVGQTESHAIVIEQLEDAARLDFDRDIYLYSQTTKSLDEFHCIIDYIKSHISPSATFRSFDTICRQVANRMPNISTFATRHDLILFVCGRKSSNGKVLFNECRRVNPNSHLIEGPEEIRPEWLNDVATVGICGATSTPKWLMEQCRDAIEQRTE
ncbi:MAG: 4-hydroxy-3-methylbut-2-enyl diphosphate reductase [Prevotella sp.]|nr:4-hydroxy-3-methylbut-2-enyl diphosphate reductase [Prevotella sp.]